MVRGRPLIKGKPHYVKCQLGDKRAPEFPDCLYAVSEDGYRRIVCNHVDAVDSNVKLCYVRHIKYGSSSAYDCPALK